MHSAGPDHEERNTSSTVFPVISDGNFGVADTVALTVEVVPLHKWRMKQMENINHRIPNNNHSMQVLIYSELS